MWLVSMELAEKEIIPYILLDRKVISFSVNRRNQRSFLAEGNIDDFVDPEHLVKTISLFSPRPKSSEWWKFFYPIRANCPS